jgi:leucyl/phenylalanyl-tRNA--protein transferase
VECWQGERLAGGLYGVALGRAFFGESMFSALPDASKVALAHLCRLDLALIDCQLPSAHLERLGARAIPRREFCARIARAVGEPGPNLATTAPDRAAPLALAEASR